MIHTKTKLVPTLPGKEPALESAVEGMSIYRAAREDARQLHRLLPVLFDLAHELRMVATKASSKPSAALTALDALQQGRA